MKWYLKVLKQYTDFHGRARRKEYWMYFLFNLIFSYALCFLSVLFFLLEISPLGLIFLILTFAYELGVFLPGLAVCVRRLHDIGKSGWYILISLIPFVGGIILLVWMCTDSVTGSNQWGENPKANGYPSFPNSASAPSSAPNHTNSNASNNNPKTENISNNFSSAQGADIKENNMYDNAVKTCPKGHYYTGDSCPYCNDETEKDNYSSRGASTSAETQAFGSFGAETTTVGDGMSGFTPSGGEHTDFISGGGEQTYVKHNPTPPTDGRTGFFDGTSTNVGGDTPRMTRKLVGWLATYSLDEMGTDFRIYEGRNSIGRSSECSITINDQSVSSRHATLLFKNGVYKIADEMSTHGTFVNGKDIEDEHFTLSDGDIIKLGSTEFLFRKSIKD